LLWLQLQSAESQAKSSQTANGSHGQKTNKQSDSAASWEMLSQAKSSATKYTKYNQKKRRNNSEASNHKCHIAAMVIKPAANKGA